MTSRRPLSPHLTIYRPQLTWIMSIGHRFTGASLALGLYLFGLARACDVSPPPWLLRWGKLGLTAPFWFHYFNGVRHLVWDTGRMLNLGEVYSTGWAVNGATLLATASTYFSARRQ